MTFFFPAPILFYSTSGLKFKVRIRIESYGLFIDFVVGGRQKFFLWKTRFLWWVFFIWGFVLMVSSSRG